MRHETVTYPADGLTMRGQLFCPDAPGKRGGVLVFPEAFGLGEHAIGRARRLAEAGFVALACDLHGEGQVLEGLEAAVAALQPLFAAPDRTRARGGAALDLLAARPEVDAGRIGAIGFCFGGTMALELARGGAGLRAAVGFHSGLGTKTPQPPPGAVTAKILVCIGADDPAIPADQIAAFEAEMRACGADWQLHLYGGVVHSFTNEQADRLGQPAFARYDAAADRRSWASMHALFAETIG